MVQRVISIRMPLAGLNVLDPYIPLESGFARELTNYSIVNGRLRVRPGNTLVETPGGTIGELGWFNQTGGSWYGIKKSDGAIYDIAAGTTGAGIGGAVGYTITRVKHASLDLIIGAQAPRLAAHPFTAWTFTTGTITATEIRCGCSHKGRLYVTNGTNVEYSDIGQITGAMPTGAAHGNQGFAVAPILDGELLVDMCSASTVIGDESNNVLCLFGNGGTVAVYSGLYPSSSTWTLIAKYKMPLPKGGPGVIPVDGDFWCSTERFAYWLSDLLSGGAAAAKANRPTAAIEPLWQTLTGPSGFPADISYCFYLPDAQGLKLDAVVLQTDKGDLDSYFDYDNNACYLVYFRQYNAWAFWVTSPFHQPAVLVDGQTYGCGPDAEIKTFNYTYMADANKTANGTYSIEASWKTPFIAPFAGRNQRSVGITPYFYNSVSGYLHRVQAIYDNSDYNTLYAMYAQENVTQIPAGKASGFSSLDMVANSYNHYQSCLPVGGIGAGLSYQFVQKLKSGSTIVQAQEMFGATAYVEDGGMIVT